MCGYQAKEKYPYPKIPRKLWAGLLKSINIDPDLQWSNLSKSNINLLCDVLFNNSYIVKGKGPFGDEFVTAGGVNLSEVHPNTMESKICQGIYFSGELLNIDGITGGFNFQHCWTSGWIAGKSIAKSFQNN